MAAMTPARATGPDRLELLSKFTVRLGYGHRRIDHLANPLGLPLISTIVARMRARPNNERKGDHMDDALTGRRVLIVGASAGIGAALGQAAIEAGASVTISARRQDKLNVLIADWGAGNAIAADATDPEAVRAMVAEAAEQMGGLDLVVYVAGFGFLQPLAETDPDGWVDVFRVNVVGANLVAGAALDHLDPDGAVAFISANGRGQQRLLRALFGDEGGSISASAPGEPNIPIADSSGS